MEWSVWLWVQSSTQYMYYELVLTVDQGPFTQLTRMNTSHHLDLTEHCTAINCHWKLHLWLPDSTVVPFVSIVIPVILRRLQSIGTRIHWSHSGKHGHIRICTYIPQAQTHCTEIQKHSCLYSCTPAHKYKDRNSALQMTMYTRVHTNA